MAPYEGLPIRRFVGCFFDLRLAAVDRAVQCLDRDPGSLRKKRNPRSARWPGHVAVRPDYRLPHGPIVRKTATRTPQQSQLQRRDTLIRGHPVGRNLGVHFVDRGPGQLQMFLGLPAKFLGDLMLLSLQSQCGFLASGPRG